MPWPPCSESLHGQCRACSCAETISSAIPPHSFCPPSVKCKLPNGLDWIGQPKPNNQNCLTKSFPPLPSATQIPVATTRLSHLLQHGIIHFACSWQIGHVLKGFQSIPQFGWRRNGRGEMAKFEQIFLDERGKDLKTGKRKGTDNGQPMSFHKFRPLQWHGSASPSGDAGHLGK